MTVSEAAQLVGPARPPVEVRRASDRCYERRQSLENWFTFDPAAAAGLGGFSTLANISEARWGPHGSARSTAPTASMEVITYVRAGSLMRSDNAGRNTVLYAGEFERTLAEPDEVCTETNPSRTHFAHVFRVSLRSRPHLVPRNAERKSFSEADRKRRPLVVASRSGTNGSVRIAQDVSMLSMLLYPGQQATHALQLGRSAWLHVVHGSVSFGELVLGKGDGVGVVGGPVSVTAREYTEILLIDVAGSGVPSSGEGGVQ